jgi:acyl-CoA synthetase (AMP-forming)/AMP-acid ligase II
MHVGIPVVPISPAYSLMSKDFGKLKQIFELVRPGLVYTSDPEKFAPALAAVSATSASLAKMLEVVPGSTLEREFSKVKPETIAKILFTSGSTGAPKGVINTHGMLCANQQQLAQAWRFVAERAPVVIDWLPWNHTFGGNYVFNLVLRNGGTLYIDGGKPVPGLVETTVRNLKVVKVEIVPNSAKDNDAFFRNRSVLEVAPPPEKDGERLKLPTYRSYRFIVTIHIGKGKAPPSLLVRTECVRDGKIVVLGKAHIAQEKRFAQYACYDVFPGEGGLGDCVIRTVVEADKETKALEFKATIVK